MTPHQGSDGSSVEGGDPRADGAETAWSFGALLEPVDLPGPGWEITEERSWPTGRLDPERAKSRRALGSGGITAWRKLGRAQPAATAWVEVVPYADAEDAEASLRQVWRFFVGAQQPDEEVVDEHTVDDQAVPGVPGPWVFEKWTTGPGGDARARYVAGAVGRVLFLTCLTAPDEFWGWAEVVGLAGAQADRARAAIGERPPG